jgi:4'-phosphopantetheinyl transferase
MRDENHRSAGMRLCHVTEPADAPLVLGADMIGVWCMALQSPSAANLATWCGCLDATELDRASTFRFAPDRATYVAAHWLLRTARAAAGGLPPQAWRYTTDPSGKPRIALELGRAELQFNLSHTRGFVACAIGRGSEIGIDVERLDRMNPGLDIARHFFSPAEIALLGNAPEERQRETFFRLWTLKEAFIKATGEGLARALDSFSLTLDPLAIAFVPVGADVASNWQFAQLQPTPQHMLALAARQPVQRPISVTVRQVEHAAAPD